jgi:hypothetical protein
MNALLRNLAALALLGCTCAAAAEPPDPADAAWEACRKRALSLKLASDYDNARRALRAFLVDFPASAHAAEAGKEAAALDGYAEKQIGGLYAIGDGFSERRRFDLALELYTEIVTRAPSPEWVAKAKAAIERNDQASEALHNAVKQKSDAFFGEWRFAEAAALLEKCAGELAGTKWAAPLARAAAEAASVRDYFAELSRKVEKSKAAPKKTPFKMKDLTGWMVKGEVASADDKGFICLVSGAGKTFTWKELLPAKPEEHPERFLAMMDLYEPAPREQLALGILLYRLGFKAAASGRLKAAGQDQGLADEVGHYQDLISGNVNQVAYDFNSGLQLMDWKAGSGRWRITGGQLVQEADEGEGELVLASRRHAAREVRLSFDLTCSASKGLLAVEFFKDDKNYFGFAFSPAQGYSTYASVAGRVSSAKDETYRLPRGQKVRIRCGLKGDTFALTAGETKLPRLTLAGLGALEGQFRLRTLDCSGRFDNVVISNRSE